MVQQVRPFLMFEGRAEEAMNLYVSLFPGAEVLELVRYGAGQPGKEGTVLKGLFRLGAQEVMCFDSDVHHAFTFTPAMSMFVDCESYDEIARLAGALGQDGGVLMGLGDYGFSRQFTWVNDRFGVSWQLNLP
jgi:predicted 3-demethylubiquinone-9 3-methyltransferase (glyoxalase superfamily)